MNIKEAKEEIERTIKTYLAKDESGVYRIPVEKQRPVFLVGAPGIGKTAIMGEIAGDLGINLVSYTITHHTRQSAIGLPFISKKNYDGTEYSVTEYTMSEIIAAIYDEIEATGIHEGILFLDEINCVSETLAPTMLQFLQYKTFGTHHVPDGFVIVTAGNPPEYNRAVRDFDIAILDRLKRIDVSESYDAWREYALKAGVHGAILSYLSIRKENFYSVRADVSGQRFVTARGWEDLSRVITVYEDMHFPITKELVSEYLEDPEIARDFATYYELYQKYRKDYHVSEILTGQFPHDNASITGAPFDEKLSLIGLLTDRLNQDFRVYAEAENEQTVLYKEVRRLKEALASFREENALITALSADREIIEREMERKRKAHNLSHAEERQTKHLLATMDTLVHTMTVDASGKPADEQYQYVKNWFLTRETERKKRTEETSEHLSNAFRFLAGAFGEGQELVLFLSDLSAGYYSLKFVSEVGNEEYTKYSRFLLLSDRRAELRDAVKNLTEGLS
ncbi:MAG: MoxR family ATPase [Oribacterium sp.]|nr:MoxR family ATPase [Oribacterium sp.]MDY6308526.1 MoxR family ATPase [Oribacterium sp.]